MEIFSGIYVSTHFKKSSGYKDDFPTISHNIDVYSPNVS